MRYVDYRKNEYHEKRHAELIGNISLQLAWSECAKSFYFEGIPQHSDIFEFGGALGYNLLALAKEHTCHMLELSEVGRSNAAKFGIRTYSDLGDLGDKKFDYILCRHVLEHVDNPLEILCTLKKYLKPRAKLILVLPVEKNDAKPVQDEIDHHLFTWNPRTILNLLSKAGFENKHYRYQYFNGRRISMPILKVLGPKAYVTIVNLLGYILKSKELVVECR